MMDKEEFDKMLGHFEEVNKEIIAKLDDEVSELRRLREEAEKELIENDRAKNNR